MTATLDQVFGVLGAIQTSMEQAVIPNTDKCVGALTNMVEVFAEIKSEIADTKKGLEKLGSNLSAATPPVPVIDNSGVINVLTTISAQLTTIIRYMVGTSVVGAAIQKKLGTATGNGVLDVIKALKGVTIKDIVSAKMKLKMLNGIIDLIIGLNKKLADSKKNGVNTKNIKEFISTITLLSDGMLKFTASMALVTVLAPIAALGVLASLVMIKMSHWLFDAMGDPRDYKNIIQGAEALKIMGTSLLMFTASMALSAIITSAVFGKGLSSFEDVLATVGVFALAFVTYAIFTAISAGKEPALAGAKTLALMSLGLLMFAGTFYLTTLMVKSIFNSDSIGGENWAAMGTTVLIFGLALGTLALFNMIAAGAPTSMVGAASLMLMSVGLLMFAGTFYLTTMMVKSMLGDKGFDDPNNLTAMAGTVAIFGLAIGLLALFGLAASLAPASMLGSISLITMSLGLLLFGFTFKTVSEMLPDEKERNSMVEFITLSIIKLTAEFTMAGLAIIPIGLGAAAVAMMGGSLISLGKGLGEFQKLAEDKIDLKELFVEYDKSPDRKGLIPTVLTGVRDAFASLVSAKSIKQNIKAKAGQLVAAGMGQVLSKLAIGVGAFGLMTTKGVPILDKDGNITGWSGPIDFPLVADNLAKVLTAVTDAVTSVIDKNGADTVEIDVPGFLGLGKKRMKVPKAQAAIQSLMGLGELMQGLSKGIETFGKLDQKKLPAIKKNMEDTIKAIGEAFTKVIGEGGTVEIDVPGFLGIGKKRMEIPKAQAGIQALMGLGEILGGMTNAIDTFKDLDDKKIKSIKTNMVTFCRGFVEAFDVDFKKIDSDAIEDHLVKSALAGKEAFDALSGIGQYDVHDMTDKLNYGVTGIIGAFTVPVKNQKNVEKLMNKFVSFAKYSKGFESISRSMDNAKNVLNSVNIEKVKVVTDLYSAMGDLMKADNSKFNKLMERVEETFGNLVNALNNNTKATEENSVATQTDSQEVIVENAEKEQKAKETKPQQPAQQSGPQSIDVNIRINGEDISDGSTLIISKQ